MDITLGYQYADFDPDDVRRQKGIFDVEKAINLFNSFPWDEQFEKVLRRQESNQSSTAPTIYFYKSENHFLSVSASTDEGFLVFYREGNRFGELYVTNNVLEKPLDLSVEQFIQDFFNDKIEEALQLYEYEPIDDQSETIDLVLNYDKSKLYRPFLFVLIPFIYLFFDYDPVLIFPIVLSMAGGLLIAVIPRLYLNFTYWKNDSDQKFSYKPKNKILTIIKNRKTIEIPKNEIKSCDLVHTRITQKAFRECSYLRIQTDNDSFIITHLTVNPEKLLQLLNVNFHDIEVFYPKLDFGLETEKDKERNQLNYQQKRTEFLQIYADWETEKLEEIIAKPDHYADYARSAASEILKKRKAVNIS